MVNVEKLLKSDFINRLLGFAERYDQVHSSNSVCNLKRWIDAQDYEHIKYFLLENPIELHIPFSMRDFISMDSSELAYYQELCTNISALIDEKRALKNEFMNFIE